MLPLSFRFKETALEQRWQTARNSTLRQNDLQIHKYAYLMNSA